MTMESVFMLDYFLLTSHTFFTAFEARTTDESRHCLVCRNSHSSLHRWCDRLQNVAIDVRLNEPSAISPSFTRS